MNIQERIEAKKRKEREIAETKRIEEERRKEAERIETEKKRKAEEELRYEMSKKVIFSKSIDVHKLRKESYYAGGGVTWQESSRVLHWK